MQCEESRKFLFEYSENALADLERQAVDRHLQQCSECNEVLAEIWEMQLLATSWQERPVPRWNRRETFFGTPPLALPWLNLVAIAASLVLLVALVFQVQIRQSDGGVTLAFGGSQDLVTTAELDQRLARRDTELQGALNDSLQLLTTQQVATSQLLMRTLLETSREERRRDLVSMMAVWETDRQRMEQVTGESFGYLIRNQLAGQRELQQISTTLRNLDLQEDNHL